MIELPLAAPTLLAGIKIAAIINVGTATIAAFIGAGGYGERIVAGLAVNDHALLLAGAAPAAAMALLVQWLFERLDRRLAPPGRGPRP
ncbi:Choline transport system permease protein OpuBB [compost metagenome]